MPRQRTEVLRRVARGPDAVDASSPVAVEPTRLAAPGVPDSVSSASWDEKVLAVRGAMRLAVDLEFDVAFDDHDEIVGVVHVVGPDLARWIDQSPSIP